ncbi:MAG: SRPBCC family protein, partial [Janthinobacterium lividum]
KAGSGRMEITQVSPDREVVFEQHNRKPFRTQSTGRFMLVPAADGTTVTWSSNGPLTTSGKLMGLFTSMEKLLGPIFEAGLTSLKADTENTS